MDFDENRLTSSMVFDKIMSTGGIKSARNGRIRIVAFQNIQNYCQRISIRDNTTSRRYKKIDKILGFYQKYHPNPSNYVHHHYITTYCQQQNDDNKKRDGCLVQFLSEG